MTGAFGISVPAKLASLHALRGAVEARSPAGALWGLAVYEAASNVVRHGYGGDSDETLDLEVWIERRAVCVRLRDRGRPNEKWDAETVPDDDGEGGYGMAIIRAVATEARYEPGPGENRLELRFAL